MFNKQHVGARERSTGTLSRRSLLLAGAGWLALQARTLDVLAGDAEGGEVLRSLGIGRCRSSPTSTFEFEARAARPPFGDSPGVWQMKDPSLAFDGSAWHLFGTGWTSGGARPDVFHAASASAQGPYVMGPPSLLHGVSGGGVAAPGVIIENGSFHMFLQTEFDVLGGGIEHLVSVDGDSFQRTDTSLVSDRALGEASIYDAQPCLIGGERYLAYAAASRVGRTQLHLARSSGGWEGPWVRLGVIVRQSDVPFQSPAGCSGYEWGLEGPQLSELPGGRVMLVGVCFLGGHGNGRRQRAFIATAARPTGPYQVLGIPFDPNLDDWATGENGHATAAVVGDTVLVIYQGRQGAGQRWSLGASRIPVARLES